MAGLIHIYCGDGKGKTSAAVGLALRAAGAGMKVLFVQFLKDGSSPEMEMLRQSQLIETDCCSSIHKFVFQMSGEERRQAEAEYSRLLENSLRRCNEGYGLLVLDEVIPACNMGIVPEATLAAFLRSKPSGLEVVLTGREPSPVLLDLADYATEMKKYKHPYDQGVPARRGIEF